MKDLLIVGCSKTKFKTAGLLPALQRYDGINYRVLKKANLNNLDILILSAKYGLIEPTTLIEDYEQRMTPNRAWELKESVCVKLQQILAQNQYREIVIVLGSDYMQAINTSLIPNATILTGGLGIKLQKLSQWLTNRLPAASTTKNTNQLNMF